MIYHDDILHWAETYQGEPFHALLGALYTLYVSISAAVASIAERHEVRHLVRFLIAVDTKPTEGLNMMHNLPACSASLASIIVAFQCLTSLGLPVRAAIDATAIDKLRVVQSVSVRITTRARAILAAAFACFQYAFIYPKLLTAVKAGEVSYIGSLRARFNSSVLASARTVFATPMF